MAGTLYDDLLKQLSRAITDPGYRQTLLTDPNGTLKAQGVDIGKADVNLQWIESTNCLNIYVKNGGANWSGAVLLKLEK
jgi:hypothetical protein